MTSTGANIVKELKQHPDQIGILASVLDARVIHMDMMTALATARQYGDDQLHDLMKAEGMSVTPDPQAPERLTSSELGLILAGQQLTTRKRGGKPGGGTKAAFAGLAQVARTNDGACNRAIGTALQDLGLVLDFDTEKSLGTSLNYASDLYCDAVGGGPVRIEVMWRSTTSRADIANYVLTKLGNYGRAIGLLGAAD
jgi:DNA (cytosine-5)-methyltransferase 1